MTGDGPWIAADFLAVDSFSGATLLAQAAASPNALSAASWSQAFLDPAGTHEPPHASYSKMTVHAALGGQSRFGTRRGLWGRVAAQTDARARGRLTGLIPKMLDQGAPATNSQ